MTRISRTVRSVALAVSTAATGGMTLSACGVRDEQPPVETKAPARSSAPPSMSPTEKKNVGSFAPSVTANPAPTAMPGRHNW